MTDTQIRRFTPQDLDEVVTVWHKNKRAAFPYVQIQQTYTLNDDRNYFDQVIMAECDVWLNSQR